MADGVLSATSTETVFEILLDVPTEVNRTLPLEVVTVTSYVPIVTPPDDVTVVSGKFDAVSFEEKPLESNSANAELNPASAKYWAWIE
jgi:hypothetical protein